MAEIIDLTDSPQCEIIEIPSDQEHPTPRRHNRVQDKKKKGRKGNRSNSLTNVGVSTSSSTQPSRVHSPEIGDQHSELSKSSPRPRYLSPHSRTSLSAANEFTFFVIDATPVAVDGPSPTPEPAVSGEGDSKLLLPSHVTVLRDDGPIPVEVLPSPKPSSDDEEYIEYLDYEDRKATGLVRYFGVEGGVSNQARPCIFKCKNCGEEGDHKTYECPIQICLICGARDEHSTRSCPISKTCYTCGMKGHINKTCPNRFSAHMASPDSHCDCDRCGSTKHKMNECPTLWRIYQYVNDEERIVVMQSREEKKQLVIGEGGEGYVGEGVWCYNCASTGHLGDDCDELPHSTIFPTEHSAFSSHNVMSGPFYDPTAELVSIRCGPREQASGAESFGLPDDWDAGAPADVGRRGKDKDKKRLEKRFREQEDEGEDWFSDIRSVKRKGKDQQVPPPESRGKTFKFGSLKGGRHELPSLPLSLPIGRNGSSLLARLSDGRGGGSRGKDVEPPHQLKKSIDIRGAAINQRNQDGRRPNSRKAERERGQDRRDRDKAGHRGSSHGPRYRGGYDSRH